MSSESFFPWEFLKSYPETINVKSPGFYALKCFDPFIEKIVLNKIPKKRTAMKWSTRIGSELSVDWFENEFMTIDLFSEERSFLILQADGMPKNVKEFLLESKIDFGNRFLFMTFSSDSKTFDSLLKKTDGHFLKINSHRFWEGQKLLEFLSSQMGIQLPYQLQNLILDIVPDTPGELLNLLKKMILQYPDMNKVTEAQIKEMSGNNKMDHFLLADWWGEGLHEKFYTRLLELIEDGDGLRSFFSFMQGHLLKLADPSYIDKKPRPSKYDKKIVLHSKRWKIGDLREEMRFFGELEILAKKKSSSMTTALRKKLLCQYQ